MQTFIQVFAGFRSGYYGTTPVTLTFLPAADVVDFLSLPQPCLHPNIAVLYGVTLTYGTCTTLVTENVTISMSHLLDEIGDQLSLRERLDIAVGCVSAIDYLHHQLGVRHGMLTCDYILISRALDAKVLDPMVASLMVGNVSLGCNAIQDDIRRVGYILLALFRGVQFSVGSEVCHYTRECCEPHRLFRFLYQLVTGQEVDILSTREIISALEGIRQTDQYRACPAKRLLYYEYTLNDMGSV